MLTKQEILPGKGTWVESRRVRGTQENRSAAWPAVSGSMAMGFVSLGGLRPIILIRSLPGGAHAWLSQEGRLARGFWEGDLTRSVPLALSRTLLLVAAYWLHIPYQGLLP